MVLFCHIYLFENHLKIWYFAGWCEGDCDCASVESELNKAMARSKRSRANNDDEEYTLPSPAEKKSPTERRSNRSSKTPPVAKVLFGNTIFKTP